MQRIIIACLIVIAAVAFSATTTAQEKHDGDGKQETAKPEADQQNIQSKSQKQSDSLTAKEKVQKAKELLAEAKEEMYYNCCIKAPCDRCALDHQSCTCNKDLREGKGICSDCYAGWQLGEGKDIPGMTKEKVKPNFHGHKH